MANNRFSLRAPMKLDNRATSPYSHSIFGGLGGIPALSDVTDISSPVQANPSSFMGQGIYSNGLRAPDLSGITSSLRKNLGRIVPTARDSFNPERYYMKNPAMPSVLQSGTTLAAPTQDFMSDIRLMPVSDEYMNLSQFQKNLLDLEGGTFADAYSAGLGDLKTSLGLTASTTTGATGGLGSKIWEGTKNFFKKDPQGTGFFGDMSGFDKVAGIAGLGMSIEGMLRGRKDSKTARSIAKDAHRSNMLDAKLARDDYFRNLRGTATKWQNPSYMM